MTPIARTIAAAALAVALGIFAVKAQAETPAPPGSDAAQEDAKPARPLTLDDLFAKLKSARDEAEGKLITATIERRWARSGSDTADLLMSRAVEATSSEDYPLAIELLDRVIFLQPQWAEAWNKRATVFFMMDDRLRAMADIEQALALEPRHFGAMSGMGMIFNANGDKTRAYKAFQQALAVNPWLDQLKSAVGQLEPDARGRDI